MNAAKSTPLFVLLICSTLSCHAYISEEQVLTMAEEAISLIKDHLQKYPKPPSTEKNLRSVSNARNLYLLICIKTQKDKTTYIQNHDLMFLEMMNKVYQVFSKKLPYPEALCNACIIPKGSRRHSVPLLDQDKGNTPTASKKQKKKQKQKKTEQKILLLPIPEYQTARRRVFSTETHKDNIRHNKASTLTLDKILASD